ncbi:hypothetical protein Desor_0743 [Desulfosporosinus orientis DSM 765]|uniref:Uncharacterized protein n=1 Tax=Desulfosporosinus orientis (strain ATCC 19365 / DSM 765 / NCIMB 8382 / VKM B-1628 / Singapore I) TaxID=768706 RepID=G7W805_DESOD|nr:hypothetical protein [Desulfosporosinus orientis]AET66431.1 hypothetical protein Desor_0743 [Desulfosporosinus orientis DSM 765]
MTARRKYLFIFLLLIMMSSLPSVASAKTDEYGYNAEARTFKGTLVNWEAFMQGLPPTTFDWKATDVIFIQRKWDKLFDPMIQGIPPSGAGAWQKAALWEYLSGDKLGWTWHQALEVVYSPDEPIPGAVELKPEEIGFTGFYLVVQKEWLVDPNGEQTEIPDVNIKKSIIKRALKGQGWKH